MMHKGYLTLVFILTLVLVGCSSSSSKKQFTNKKTPDGTYLTAQQKLQDGKWKQAIIYLELMEDYYPCSSYSQQVQLDLIYAYYKNNDLLLAKIAIDRFVRLNPMHPNIDYVMYMRGLIDMALDDNMLQNLFGVDRSNYNPQHISDAFRDFSKLVHSYPNSKYVADATNRLISLKDRLAKYEYSVADYYAQRGAWIAVINRVDGIIRNYQDTKIMLDSLKLMENAYRHMQMDAQADKVASIIIAANNNT